METLISNGIKVDMILCDLPYGTTACSWDAVIPFEPLWSCYKRLIKENGAIVLFGSQPFTTDLINSNRGWFKYEIIWEKERPSNPLLCKRQILKYHENILLFCEGQSIYNPQKPRRKDVNKRKNKARAYVTETIGDKPIYADMNLSGEAEFIYPASIQYFPMERGEHPTQKPEDLLKWIVSTYSNKDELILDNTMGSGSTGVACMETQRRFIGIETERKYFDIAEKRICAVANQIKLF